MISFNCYSQYVFHETANWETVICYISRYSDENFIEVYIYHTEMTIQLALYIDSSSWGSTGFSRKSQTLTLLYSLKGAILQQGVTHTTETTSFTLLLSLN